MSSEHDKASAQSEIPSQTPIRRRLVPREPARKYVNNGGLHEPNPSQPTSEDWKFAFDNQASCTHPNPYLWGRFHPGIRIIETPETEEMHNADINPKPRILYKTVIRGNS